MVASRPGRLWRVSSSTALVNRLVGSRVRTSLLTTLYTGTSELGQLARPPTPPRASQLPLHGEKTCRGRLSANLLVPPSGPVQNANQAAMPITVFGPGILYRRGQLARLLGIERSQIRWIPGVLEEVSTRLGIRYEFRRPYLTRTQVARTLHKSRTAVIAIEGTILHPERGPGDVRLFEVDEVTELVGRPLGAAAHSRWFLLSKRRSPAITDGSTRRRSDSGTSDTLGTSRRSEQENGKLRAMLAEHFKTWEQVHFTFDQRHMEQKVRAMLAEHLKVCRSLRIST